MQVGLVPLQAPRHSRKVAPAAEVAVRVTLVPLGKLALQVLPQAIPAGLDAMVPSPLPALVRLRETDTDTLNALPALHGP
jgi:hypothetical protein